MPTRDVEVSRRTPKFQAEFRVVDLQKALAGFSLYYGRDYIASSLVADEPIVIRTSRAGGKQEVENRCGFRGVRGKVMTASRISARR